MFPGCLQDFSRMFSGCSDGSYWPGRIWWSFQMKVWTLKIQRNLMIPNYSMIPAIRWSPAIWWSIVSIHFHNPKVYGDTSISDGSAFLCQFQCFWQIFVLPHLVQPIIIARTHEHHKYVTSLLPEWRGGKVGCFPPKQYLCFIQLPSISANITVVLIFNVCVVGLIQSVAQVTVEAETLIVRDVPVFAEVW